MGGGPIFSELEEEHQKFNFGHTEAEGPRGTATWRCLIISWVLRAKASGKKPGLQVKSGSEHGDAD